ncbi:MAG: TonB-dependent receptor domain-containing protein [Acidobacteriaceae bacterium]
MSGTNVKFENPKSAIARMSQAVLHRSSVLAFGCLALLCVLLLALPAQAQLDRGTITGTITDSTGAVIPGVSVVALNPATGQKYTSVTNAAGIYNLLNLPIATYDVTYSKKGFATFVHKGVAIQVQQRAQLNVKLQVGSEAQTVTVTAAPLLKVNTELGTNMTAQEVQTLPLSAYQGSSITSFAYAITPTLTGGDYQGQVGGSQSSTKEVLINGTSADASRVGHIGESEPPMDAVGQFQIDTSGISAAAGRTGGGAFLFELKQGSNQFHGTSFIIYSNKVLDANTWTNDYYRGYYDSTDPANAATYNTQYAKPTNTFKEYGVSGGFPILRNRMFLYAAYERYNQANFSTTEGGVTVPTTRMLTGDFSELLNPAAPTLGKDSCGNTIYSGAIWNPASGCVFVGNVIPQQDLSSVSQKIAAIYAKYYSPTITTRDTNNYPSLNEVDPKFTQDQLSFNYTWDLTPNNRINSSYIYVRRPRYNAALQSGSNLWSAGSQDGGPLASGGIQTVTSNAYRISDSWTVTPNLLNVASFTFNQFQNKAVPLTGSTNWVNQIGLGAYQSVPNFPLITFGGSTNGVSEVTIGSSRTPHTGGVDYNGILDDTVTIVHGRHVIHLGFEARALGINTNTRGGALHFNFNNNTGAPLNAKIQSQTGFAFANFILGDVQSASKDTQFNQYGRRKEIAFFAEDAYKITPKLTLDYALRWDIPYAEHVLGGEWSNFTTSAVNPNFGAFVGSMQYLTKTSQTFETNSNYKQFGPHFGVSYMVTPRIVVRGSWGMYYAPLGNNNYGAVPYGSSYGYHTINQVLHTGTAKDYAFNWDSGYPGQEVAVTADNSSPYVPYGPASVSPDTLTMGRTQNWNLNLQYQFANTWVLHVSYIGNTGRKLHDGALTPYNWPTWSTYQPLYQTGHAQQFISNAGQAAALNIPYPYAGWTGTAYQAIDPYPQVARTYGPIFFVNSPLGRTAYNAFVLEVTKRTANGLSMNLSYTLAKLTGNTSDAFVDTYSASHGYQNPYLYNQYGKAVEAGYPPQIFKGFVTYQLPFGHGQRFFNHSRLSNYLLGGWMAGAIVDLQSGAPFGAVHSNNFYPGWSGVWVDVAPNANFKNNFKKLDLINLTDPSNQFVDPTIFSNPADGELGNSPVSYPNWHGWGTSDADMSLMKKFGFGPRGRYVLTLRGEFFNVFNQHHYGNPNLNIASPYFGQVTGVTGSPRQGQVSARVSW